MKNLLSLKHLLFLFIFLVGSVFAQESRRIMAEDDEIERIISTYEKNQARFHLQYKGKIISGTAVVESIKTDVFGSGKWFNIKLKNYSSLLSCQTLDRDMAAKFDQNQTVEFTGVIDDVSFKRLELTNCSAKLKVKPELLNDDSIARIFSEQQKIPYEVAKFLVSKSKADEKKSFSDRQHDKYLIIDGRVFLISTLVNAIDLNQDGKLDYFFLLESYCGNAGQCGHFIVFSRGSSFEIFDLGMGNQDAKDIKFDTTKKPPIIMMSQEYHLQWKGSAFVTVYEAPDPMKVNCKTGQIIWDNARQDKKSDVYQFKGRLSVIEQRKQMNPTPWAIWSETDRDFVDGCRACGYNYIMHYVEKQCPILLKN